MEPRISLITVGVSHLERSRRFYQDVLRLPFTREAEWGPDGFLWEVAWNRHCPHV